MQESKAKKHKNAPPTHPRTKGKTQGKRGKGNPPTQKKKKKKKKKKKQKKKKKKNEEKKRKKNATRPEKTQKRIDKITGEAPRTRCPADRSRRVA